MILIKKLFIFLTQQSTTIAYPKYCTSKSIHKEMIMGLSPYSWQLFN